MALVIGLEKVCYGSLHATGAQPWEEVLSVIRIVCTVVTASIISSWYTLGIGRRMLLFLHWVGGLVHFMAGLALAQMIFYCWVEKELLTLIKVFKFFELAGSNLAAVTNLAIGVNLAFIVHSHRTLSRVKSVSAFHMAFLFVFISAAFAALPVPFWHTWQVTATTFFPRALTTARERWVSISYIGVETVDGVVLATIVGLLLLFRQSDLREVWRLHRRVRIFVALTTTALTVNITIAVAGFFIIFQHEPFWLIIVSWSLRYIHIALDTIVLYSALETPIFQ